MQFHFTERPVLNYVKQMNLNDYCYKAWSIALISVQGFAKAYYFTKCGSPLTGLPRNQGIQVTSGNFVFNGENQGKKKDILENHLSYRVTIVSF